MKFRQNIPYVNIREPQWSCRLIAHLKTETDGEGGMVSQKRY